MTNSLCVLLYAPLLVASVILLIAILAEDTRRFVIRQYIVFSLLLIGWLVCAILFYLIKDPFWLRYLFDLKLVFVAYLAVAQFWIVAGFYHLDKAFPRWAKWCMCIIPTVTALLSLTTLWHPLILEQFSVVQLAPLVITEKVRGVWFTVHNIYSQLLALGLAVVVFSQQRKLPKGYRTPSNILIIGIVLYYIATFVETLGIERTTLDFVLISICLDSILFYLAAISTGRGSFLHIERREAFNNLEDPVFILDALGRIADANRPAVSWLGALGRTLEYIPFDELMCQLSVEGAITQKPLPKNEGTDVYLLKAGTPQVYYMRQQDVAGQEGACVILTDVTRNRLLIERLRDAAGIDPLTKTANRYRYQALMHEMDTPSQLPLSVIMGDVNHLKQINDSYGHEEGDRLLSEVARILHECCPPDGVPARIGGDEFALLLPGCDHQCALGVARSIRERLEEVDSLKEKPTIALGCATKNEPGQDLRKLIEMADIRMLDTKK